MRLHRFYIHPKTALKQDFWLHEATLLHQWNKVLRFRVGQEVVLFDGVEHERLYKISELKASEAHLELVTEFKRQVPSKDITLFWSLLKRDKNDWVLQKCTELGVSHFVPLLADRSEKTGFDLERAKRIIIESAEQCGRSDIPTVRELVLVQTCLAEFAGKIDLYLAEKGTEPSSKLTADSLQLQRAAGVLVGPEGGWSDAEKQLFTSEKIKHLNLHDFTLRAETASVVAATKLI